MDQHDPTTDGERHVALRDLQTATGLSPQRLRYVIDQQLLPQPSVSWCRGRGSARQFTVGEALATACAALLLQAGIRRRVVRSCLQILADYQIGLRTRSRPLPQASPFQVLQAPTASYLQIGDGEYVRVVTAAQAAAAGRPARGWVKISSLASRVTYEPMVTLSIDVARLRRLLPKPLPADSALLRSPSPGTEPENGRA